MNGRRARSAPSTSDSHRRGRLASSHRHAVNEDRPGSDYDAALLRASARPSYDSVDNGTSRCRPACACDASVRVRDRASSHDDLSFAAANGSIFESVGPHRRRLRRTADVRLNKPMESPCFISKFKDPLIRRTLAIIDTLLSSIISATETRPRTMGK
jgi:hypothetical protein